MLKLTNTEHWLIQQARLSPNQTAIYTSEGKINYSNLFEQSFAVAEYLSSVGIGESDNVCILSGHSYQFWIIVNAIWFLGAVPVPLNSRNTAEEISRQIQQVDAKFLITFQHTLQLDKLEFVNHISLDDFDFLATTDSQNDFHHSTFPLRLAPVQPSAIRGVSSEASYILHSFCLLPVLPASQKQWCIHSRVCTKVLKRWNPSFHLAQTISGFLLCRFIILADL